MRSPFFCLFFLVNEFFHRFYLFVLKFIIMRNENVLNIWWIQIWASANRKAWEEIFFFFLLTVERKMYRVRTGKWRRTLTQIAHIFQAIFHSPIFGARVYLLLPLLCCVHRQSVVCFANDKYKGFNIYTLFWESRSSILNTMGLEAFRKSLLLLIFLETHQIQFNILSNICFSSKLLRIFWRLLSSKVPMKNILVWSFNKLPSDE